jgi:hypothetical protein
MTIGQQSIKKKVNLVLVLEMINKFGENYQG